MLKLRGVSVIAAKRRLSPRRALLYAVRAEREIAARFGGYCTERVKKMRVKITLACTECKQRNYDTMKNKKNDPDRLEMNKYCRFCRKHTLHKETK